MVHRRSHETREYECNPWCSGVESLCVRQDRTDLDLQAAKSGDEDTDPRK